MRSITEPTAPQPRASSQIQRRFSLLIRENSSEEASLAVWAFYSNLVNFWLVRFPGVVKAPRGLNFSSISLGRQGLSIGVDLRRTVLC